jgi:hypothetical protein
VTSQFIFVALGAVLILTGVIGGGFEVRELKIPQVKWPTRVIAFVAGFVFVLMGAGLNLSPDVPHVTPVVEARTTAAGVIDARETTRPETRPETRPADDAWLRNSLEAAVLKASDAQIRASQENNPSLLNGLVIGEGYRKIAAGIQTLAKEDLYAVDQLLDQQFESFSVDPSGQRAEVRVTETWTTAWHSTRTHECKVAFAPHRVPQTVSLERHGDRWIQSDFTTYGASPIQTRCP